MYMLLQRLVIKICVFMMCVIMDKDGYLWLVKFQEPDFPHRLLTATNFKYKVMLLFLFIS